MPVLELMPDEFQNRTIAKERQHFVIFSIESEHSHKVPNSVQKGDVRAIHTSTEAIFPVLSIIYQLLADARENAPLLQSTQSHPAIVHHNGRLVRFTTFLRFMIE